MKNPPIHTHANIGLVTASGISAAQCKFHSQIKKKDIRNRYKNILQNIERDPTPVPQKVLGKAQRRETLGKIHKKRWNL